LANTLNNIALIHLETEKYDRASDFASKCLDIRKGLNDRVGVAQALNLLGLIAQNEMDLNRADSLFNAALAVYNQDQNAWGISMVEGNLGEIALTQRRFREALEHCQLSFDLSVENELEWEETACECLAQAHQQLGNSTEASRYWKRLIAIKDSIYAKNALSDIALQTQRFEHEKQQLLVEQEFERQATLAAAELERQKLLGNASIVIGILSIVLFFLLYRNYSNKQRDNELLEAKNQEITAQKEIIQEKNEHITDSIRYAERLQAAILPKQELFEQLFSGHSILYRPKDIVSGDFYYLEEFNGNVFVAVADCTGHGVPGAMVSMVGYQGLNKAILEENLTSPATILQRLSDHVEEAFVKSGGSVRDGMDISLCVIDRKKGTACFAGAHNGLLIVTGQSEIPDSVRHDTLDNMTLFELKADRRSIGGYSHATTFNDHNFQVTEGDVLTLFSDGFPDQFGGENGRKMGAKRLRELVLKAASSTDSSSLENAFVEWQGKEEQVDDVTLISLVI
jgi:serine phosphatase RsbU (regulator of sigma subunit)